MRRNDQRRRLLSGGLYARGSRCFTALLAVSLMLAIPLAAQDSEGGTDPDHERIVLQLKWVHQFQFAGFYAAVDKGFYRDAGLDVELVAGTPELRPIEEVVAGRAHYGVANSEILYHRLHGEPVVALAVVFQHSPSVLVTRKDSGISAPHHLVGRKVMLRKGNDSAEILSMLIDEGIPLDGIEQIDISYDVQDLIDGKTDAYHAYLTDQPYQLESQGIPSTVIHPMTYGIDFYGDTIFTTEREIENHPKRVRKFREASLRGWEYAMEHPGEIIDIMMAEYPVRATREHLHFEAESMRDLIHPELIALGHMNPGRWRHIAQTYVKLGMVEPEYSLEGFLYDPSLSPDFAWVRRILWTMLGAVVLTGTTALLLLFFNSRLRTAVRQQTQELSVANDELLKHRLRLEEMVEARTTELADANEMLQNDIGERQRLIGELKTALSEVKTLSGLLPICASCKRVRDDKGYWNQIEAYISDRSDADFSHSICPECAKELYPNLETGKPE